MNCMSVLPSVLLSSSFLGIGTLVFSETLYGVRGSYRDVRGRALDFFRKISFRQNWPKMVKWCPKMFFFWLFRKVYSLVSSGNVVEWKYLWPFNILRKPYRWRKSVSQVMLKKMLLVNQISVFVNCQYLINELTSGPDFLHVDRHEWTQQGPKLARLHNPKEFFEILHNKRGQDVHENYINGFSEKRFILDKWTILDLKMV